MDEPIKLVNRLMFMKSSNLKHTKLLKFQTVVILTITLLNLIPVPILNTIITILHYSNG